MTFLTSNPLISICIPVFNGENYIIECIESALSQTYQNLEVIVVDNASFDNTSKIVNNITDSRLKYFKNNENIGSIKNFNKCFELSSGDYFLLLPHDDLIPPDAIQIYFNKLSNSDKVFAFSAHQTINKNSEYIKNKKFSQNDKSFDHLSLLNFIIQNFNPIQSVFVKRKNLFKYFYFDQKFGIFTDIELWIRLSKEFNGCEYICKPLYKIRIHSGQGQKIIDDPSENIKHFPENEGNISYNHFFLIFLKYIVKNYNNKINKYYLIEKIIFPSVLNSTKKLLTKILKYDFTGITIEFIFFKKINNILNSLGFFFIIQCLVILMLNFFKILLIRVFTYFSKYL